MEREQLLTKRQIFKHEILTGSESANQPAEKMPEPSDHNKNLIETSSTRLVARSLILQMYGVLMTHNGSNPEQLRVLSERLIEQQIEEVVMESTAQYWKPVWGALERYWKPMWDSREGAGRMSGTLHLAQALSNRGRRGRKRDFPDAERLVKRLVSQELVLSFVPDAEQRLWRTLTRTVVYSIARVITVRTNWQIGGLGSLGLEFGEC